MVRQKKRNKQNPKKEKQKWGLPWWFQQLRLQASKAGDARSIPDQGNRIIYAIRCSQWGREKKKPNENQSCNSVIMLLVFYWKEVKNWVHTKTSTWIFTAALSITLRTWKQPRCPSIVGEWNVQRMEYYSPVEKNSAIKPQKDTQILNVHY